MSQPYWKPGDVCVYANVRGMYTSDGRWVWEDGSSNAGSIVLGTTARPLAVIDPDDGEQVAALVTSMHGHKTVLRQKTWLGPIEDDRGALRAALREAASPPAPKPEEPLGWLAVVRDDGGELWVRTGWDGGLDKPWQRGAVHRHWAIVDAVEVVSSGVEALA